MVGLAALKSLLQSGKKLTEELYEKLCKAYGFPDKSGGGQTLQQAVGGLAGFGEAVGKGRHCGGIDRGACPRGWSWPDSGQRGDALVVAVHACRAGVCELSAGAKSFSECLMVVRTEVWSTRRASEARCEPRGAAHSQWTLACDGEREDGRLVRTRYRISRSLFFQCD
jgi:hypothetical protein